MKSAFIYLTGFGAIGGLEKFNRSFIKALSEIKGDKAQFLSLNDNTREEQYLNSNINMWHTTHGNKFWFLFKAISLACKVDVVILGHLNLAIIALLIKFFMPNKKVLMIFHGIEVWQGNTKVQMHAYGCIDHMLAVSNFTKSQLIKIHDIQESKITVFPNTIDPFFPITKDFTRPAYLLERYGLKQQTKVLLSVCRLSSDEAYKGYDTVLRVLPEVLREHPDIMYLVVGKSDAKEKDRLTRMIEELKVGKHVKLIGFVPDEELNDHFLLGNVFVMPSRNEGFGIVFIEAMACGIPVIGGNADGSVDALANGELGTLVDPNNLAEVANAILSKLSETWQVHEKIQLQQQVLKRFGFDAFQERLRSVLQTL